MICLSQVKSHHFVYVVYVHANDAKIVRSRDA